MPVGNSLRRVLAELMLFENRLPLVQRQKRKDRFAAGRRVEWRDITSSVVQFIPIYSQRYVSS